MMAIKTPNPTDKHVGARIRMRRLMLGMSQTALADGLDLTFQQIQKYEKGVNRVGASRLQQIAHILRVPVEFFFEGGPAIPGTKAGAADAPSLAHVSEFLATPDGLALVAGFVKIRSAKLRRAIVELVSYLAQSQDK
jgi:transcriptional regulator with XRE-family HTH domain